MKSSSAHLSPAGAFGPATTATASPRPVDRPRLGELLIGKGFIDQRQLSWALSEAQTRRELLGVVLLRERMIFEDELARTLSQQLALPYINIRQVGFDAAAARLLPMDVGMAAAAIPIRVTDQVVQVGFADPTDEQALAAVHEHLPKISIAVAELSEIRRAWHSVSGR